MATKTKAEKSAEKPVPISINNITQLETLTMNVEFEWHDGTLYSVPMRTLTIGRWAELDAMVADPTPPVIGGGKNNVVYDFNDAAFLAAKRRAETKRNMLKFADSCGLDIPGETLEAKADFIENKMDGMIVNTLWIALRNSFSGRLAQAQARAEQFQRNGTDDTQNLS